MPRTIYILPESNTFWQRDNAYGTVHFVRFDRAKFVPNTKTVWLSCANLSGIRIY